MPPTDAAVPNRPVEVAEDLDFRASRRRSQARREHAARGRSRDRARRFAAIACTGLGLAAASVAVAQDGGGAAAQRGTAMTLAVGSSGERVAALQARVGAVADGIFGPRTRAAVRRFQRAQGLPVTGVADAATLSAAGVHAGSAAPRAVARPAPSATLQRIAQCESGGNPTSIGGGGRYRGKYQFSRETWRSVGGSGDPAAAPEAEQDRRAAILLAREGTSPWPNCA